MKQERKDPERFVLVSWRTSPGRGESGFSILETSRLDMADWLENRFGGEWDEFSKKATRLKVLETYPTMEEALLKAESLGIVPEKVPSRERTMSFDSDEIENFMYWSGRKIERCVS